MPKKLGTIFICNSCGNEFSSWAGRCSVCGEWNTLKEVKENLTNPKFTGEKILPQRLSEIKMSVSGWRQKTGFSEVDRVFGAGIVAGSVVLLGGEPGIGKSTLLLQVVSNFGPILYISGEESAEQLKIRANRLKISTDNILISNTSDISALEATISDISPKMIVVDSIQTAYDSRISGSAGSQLQVKECGLVLMQLAKKYNVSVVIIGQVTKDGSVAGPKMLEHLVDVVIYMEGERNHNARILRCNKNRFGNTDEIAVLKMTEDGLVEVKNPGALFLSQSKNAPGSATCVLLEGTRPLLVEIQALVTSTNFGYPRRTTSGFDLNRLNILIGVMIKRAGINLSNQDVYLNVAGGITADEPAADLAVCLAIASSFKNKPLPEKSAYFAEVGLTGELRKILAGDKRKKEAEKLGFRTFSNYKNINQAIGENLG